MSLPLRTASAPALKRSFAASAFPRCADFTRDRNRTDFSPHYEADATTAVPATLTERRVTLSELRGLSLSPSDANPRDDANNPSGREIAPIARFNRR